MPSARTLRLFSMPSQRLQGTVAAMNQALARGDLDQAQRQLAQLRRGFEAIAPAELQTLQAPVSQWLQQVTQLRARYARDLRDMLRRRQNVTAYHDVGSPPLR